MHSQQNLQIATDKLKNAFLEFTKQGFIDCDGPWTIGHWLFFGALGAQDIQRLFDSTERDAELKIELDDLEKESNRRQDSKELDAFRAKITRIFTEKRYSTIETRECTTHRIQQWNEDATLFKDLTGKTKKAYEEYKKAKELAESSEEKKSSEPQSTQNPVQTEPPASLIVSPQKINTENLKHTDIITNPPVFEQAVDRTSRTAQFNNFTPPHSAPAKHITHTQQNLQTATDELKNALFEFAECAWVTSGERGGLEYIRTFGEAAEFIIQKCFDNNTKVDYLKMILENLEEESNRRQDSKELDSFKSGISSYAAQTLHIKLRGEYVENLVEQWKEQAKLYKDLTEKAKEAYEKYKKAKELAERNEEKESSQTETPASLTVMVVESSNLSHTTLTPFTSIEQQKGGDAKIQSAQAQSQQTNNQEFDTAWSTAQINQKFDNAWSTAQTQTDPQVTKNHTDQNTPVSTHHEIQMERTFNDCAMVVNAAELSKIEDEATKALLDLEEKSKAWKGENPINFVDPYANISEENNVYDADGYSNNPMSNDVTSTLAAAKLFSQQPQSADRSSRRTITKALAETKATIPHQNKASTSGISPLTEAEKAAGMKIIPLSKSQKNQINWKNLPASQKRFGTTPIFPKHSDKLSNEVGERSPQFSRPILRALNGGGTEVRRSKL